MPRSGSAGQFLLGYENELAVVATTVEPAALWHNGTLIGLRRIRQHVTLFRRFLHDKAEDAGEKLLAAKMIGRWRSGSPLARAPETDGWNWCPILCMYLCPAFVAWRGFRALRNDRGA